ncbi:TPA: hypothetical protein F8R99_14185 [Legionella pneumophila]|nr:hypothetical protein [Legionella pneumophila]
MIDCDKLKKAHELSEKLSVITNENVIIQITYRGENNLLFNIYQNDMSKFDSSMLCLSLDGLIKQLEELTQPKPKYKIGDKAWYLSDEYEPFLLFIEDIDYDSDVMYMDSNDNWWHEEQLYPSRESLIDAQIEYWKGMKQEQIVPIEEMSPPFEGEVKGFDTHKPCEHERDGILYRASEHGSVASHRCKKCGEFYR